MGRLQTSHDIECPSELLPTRDLSDTDSRMLPVALRFTTTLRSARSTLCVATSHRRRRVRMRSACGVGDVITFPELLMPFHMHR